MQSAPIPANEADRLAALHSLHILDTAPEPAYDDLVRLASSICGTPISLVSLIDADRQWFKATAGIEATQTTRDVAFCAHAILHQDVFVVPDAHEDDRFRDNPLVTQAPHVRFYAGMPLTTPEGHNLGTLCVIDHQPRTMKEEQRIALRVLGRQVVAQLLLRRQVTQLEGLIAERTRTEAILRASEAKFRSVVDRLAEGVFVIDVATRRFIDVNATMLKLLGYTVSEFLALDVFEIVAKESREMYARTVREMDGILARDGRCDLGRRQLRRKDGTGITVDIRVSEVPNEGAGLHAVVIRDVTEQLQYEERLFEYQLDLEQANAKLRALATTDGLTGANNRASLNDKLQEAFDRALRYERSLSFVLVDVDHFKSFNDTFGHPAGDTVLKAVAKVLQNTVRSTDIVARYGGEEFAVILPDTEYAGAMVLAERCRRAIAGAIWEQRDITVSVGVSTLTASTGEPMSLVQEADEALYRSKQAGRNRVSHHHTDQAHVGDWAARV